MRSILIKTMTICFVLSAPATALAGGVFGEIGNIANSVSIMPSAGGAATTPPPVAMIVIPSSPSDEDMAAPSVPQPITGRQALQNYDLQLRQATPRTDLTNPFDSYESLKANQSQETRQMGQALQELLGVPVSNVCLTAKGACEVAHSTTGTTCFCGGSGGIIELGVLQ